MRLKSKYYDDINKPFANGATNICITFAVIFLVLWGVVRFINGYAASSEERELTDMMGSYLSYYGYTYDKVEYEGLSGKIPKELENGKVHRFTATEVKTPDGVFYEKANVYIEIEKRLPRDLNSFYGVEPF